MTGLAKSDADADGPGPQRSGCLAETPSTVDETGGSPPTPQLSARRGPLALPRREKKQFPSECTQRKTC